MKIRPAGAEFRAGGWVDGRTDRRDETESSFSQICELY